MFNYNHLYYFYVTAKMGGVTCAARALRIAQPSLSAQIKTLERKLNLRLFQKVGRVLVLTADGERAFAHCRKIFEAAEDFSDYLANSSASRVQRCRIGVSREIDRPFVADILSSILRKRVLSEQPLLSMRSDDHARLVESLRAGDLDALITNQPVYGGDVRPLVELSMPVIGVISAALHRKLAPKKGDSLAAIARASGVGLILPSENLKMRLEADLFLQKIKVRNRIVFESDILAAVVRAALEGAGIAFLPRPYVTRELDQGDLLPVGSRDGCWRHNILIVARNIKNLEPTVIELRDYFMRLSARSE